MTLASDIVRAWRNLALRDFTPQLVTSLAGDYGFADLRKDALAGLTVAVVALPLGMALAIASGVTPDKGLLTVIIAGFLISVLGGSRVQIGGPTGAFVVIVYGVVEKHGPDGLVLATFMAGAILLAAAVLRVGAWMKYMPQPVITGFTAGIAVIIASSQIKDILGEEGHVPAAMIPKLEMLVSLLPTIRLETILLAAGSLVTMLVLRRLAPRLPSFLIGVALASFAAALLQLPAATIGSEFGVLPRSLPAPHIPDISIEKLQLLLPSAFTIAFLAGLESLLSAVVADGMTGDRHRSHCELMAQGIANMVSALFGGMPATGAIARTATNIRAGARSPLSGVFHALFVLLFMALLAPLAGAIPLASLGAVLLIVAWNMSEVDQIMRLMRGPWGDRFVLFATFALTVFADLTLAIEAGVVMAAVLFMHRMAESVEFQLGVGHLGGDGEELPPHPDMRERLPPGVEAFQIRGPLFFGVSGRLLDVLDRTAARPTAFIIRMGQVPMIDTSGATALADFVRRARARGIRVVVSGLRGQPLRILDEMGLISGAGHVETAQNFAAAIALLEVRGHIGAS